MEYYCSQKFDWLEVRLYDGYVASCCKATPSKLTTKELTIDPAGFFNWPEILNERQQMLGNQPVSGCERACWSQEEQGLSSRRITFHRDLVANNKPTYYNTIRRIPRILNLVVSNTCNLTCSYCCKNFSSTWLRDVLDHGNYDIDDYQDRYNATARDQVLYASSQKLMDQTQLSKLISEQIANNSLELEEITITGGEPLLYSKLEQTLETFSGKNITIYTGLGIPNSRLKQLLPTLKKHNVLISVSAENTGVFHEFNRYGSHYPQFRQNLQDLKEHCQVLLVPTISNLTVFDFPNFVRENSDCEIRLTNMVHDPEFFRLGVLDPTSKQQLIDQFGEYNSILTPMLQVDYSDKYRVQLYKFLTRFIRTRSLTLDIYPEHFVQWLYKGNQ